jgi:hypothetical protein
MVRVGLEGGSWREKHNKRGVSVVTQGGPREMMRSAEGRGEDSVLAYTDVQAFFI